MTLFFHSFQDKANPWANFAVQSLPGTGKTKAFGIALLSHIDVTINYPQAICVSATHEAAIQTSQIMSKLGFFTNVNIGLAVPNENES